MRTGKRTTDTTLQAPMLKGASWEETEKEYQGGGRVTRVASGDNGAGVISACIGKAKA